MNCKVCNSSNSKYKCPVCRISYCSVVCWKSHKSGSCQESPEENIVGMGSEEIAPPSYRYETEDTVPMHKLKLLEESEGLREVLKNANVRDMLVAIDNAPDPGKAIHAAMLEPIFVEFADECLKIVQPPCLVNINTNVLRVCRS